MKKILYLICLVFVVASCEPKYEKTYSWSYPVSGDWLVNAYIGDDFYYGPFEIRAFNTSMGQDSIWIDDYDGNFWDFQVKAAVNMDSLTFRTSGSINAIPGYDIGIIVRNGKIVNKDSIYLEMEFDDDAGTVYTFKGHRETSYDDYMENF